MVGHTLTEDNEGEVAYRQLLTITDYDEANSHNNDDDDDDDDDDGGCRNAATEFAAVGRATTHSELTHFVSKLLTLMTSIIIGLMIIDHCQALHDDKEQINENLSFEYIANNDDDPGDDD